MKNILKFIGTFLLVLNTHIALGAEITIPAGTKVENYKYTDSNDPAKLSACGIYSSLNNDVIVADLDFLYDSGPFYQYLKVRQPLELTINQVKTQYREGTDCNFKGFDREDPDWKCSEDIYGYWTSTTIYFNDNYGNLWHSGMQSKMVSSAKQTLSYEAALSLTLQSIKERLSYCSVQ